MGRRMSASCVIPKQNRQAATLFCRGLPVSPTLRSERGRFPILGYELQKPRRRAAGTVAAVFPSLNGFDRYAHKVRKVALGHGNILPNALYIRRGIGGQFGTIEQRARWLCRRFAALICNAPRSSMVISLNSEGSDMLSFPFPPSLCVGLPHSLQASPAEL